MAELLYNLTNDTLFKMLFVKYPELLKRLVAKILGIPIDGIAEFKITNPEMPPCDDVDDKFCRLDIIEIPIKYCAVSNTLDCFATLAMTSLRGAKRRSNLFTSAKPIQKSAIFNCGIYNMEVNGERVNLEVQVKDEHDYPERSLYYWARAYSSALHIAQKYADLPRTILINIIAFKLFKDVNDVHSEFRPMEVNRHTLLTDRMSLHYFELPKLPKVEDIDASDEVELWLAAINAKTEEQLSTIKTIGGEPMEQLVEAYHNVAASPEFREMVRQRERALHNEASALANAKLEERQEIVKNMYKERFGVADIVKATKFSEKDVKDILGVN